MIKMNRNGYMLVEIIVSFSIAFVIFISLTNLVLKFKDVNEETYYETKYLKDKTLITRNIMNDLEKVNVVDVSSQDNELILDVEIENDEGTTIEQRKLKIDKDKNTITYGKWAGSNFVTDDVSYYSKKVESSLMLEGLDDCSNKDDGYFCAKIKVSSVYNDDNYDIKLYSVNKDV